VFEVYKIIIILFLLILVVAYIVVNLGNFIDVTEEPKQADIIVSLGGDYSGCRLKKAISIYKDGISQSRVFIYTGTDTAGKSFENVNSRKQYLLNQNIEEKNIVHVSKKLIRNTMEEVLFIKKYMLHNNYKSVLFISHPQHSRRISSLANVIAGYKNAGLSLSVASCNPNWWKKNKYYANEISFYVTLNEMEKLFYNLLKYSPPLISFTSYKKNDKDALWSEFIDLK